MTFELETLFFCDLMLTLFDFCVGELGNTTAVRTDQVVMVITVVEFKDRLATIKLAASQNPGLFKLGQDAVDGRQANIDAFAKQGAIDVLSAQVALTRFSENIQNFQARKCGLQTNILQITLIVLGLQGKTSATES